MSNQLTPEQLLKFNITEDIQELGYSFNGVDLICENAESFRLHKIKYAIAKYDIFGLGGKAYKEIAKIIDKPHQIFFLNQSTKFMQDILGRSKGKTLIDGLNKLRNEGIPLWKIIIGLMVDDCGTTISKEFAKYYANKYADINVSYSFDGLQKSVIVELESRVPELTKIISELHDNSVIVQFPEEEEKISDDAIFYVMTGSPKEFGFKTKSEFSNSLPKNFIEQKGMNSETHYLITDDLSSKSSKMKKAEKLGIKVILYTDSLFN